MPGLKVVFDGEPVGRVRALYTGFDETRDTSRWRGPRDGVFWSGDSRWASRERATRLWGFG